MGMLPHVKSFLGLNKSFEGETKMEEDGGMGGEVKWGERCLIEREGLDVTAEDIG